MKKMILCTTLQDTGYGILKAMDLSIDDTESP